MPLGAAHALRLTRSVLILEGPQEGSPYWSCPKFLTKCSVTKGGLSGQDMPPQEQAWTHVPSIARLANARLGPSRMPVMSIIRLLPLVGQVKYGDHKYCYGYWAPSWLTGNRLSFNNNGIRNKSYRLILKQSGSIGTRSKEMI